MTDRRLPELMFGDTYGARVASVNSRSHRQRVARDLMKCPSCRENNCAGCPDKIFLILGKEPVCTCTREGHADAINGEPRRAQVIDPLTGDIYGPGGKVATGEEGSLEQSPEAD